MQKTYLTDRKRRKAVLPRTAAALLLLAVLLLAFSSCSFLQAFTGSSEDPGTALPDSSETQPSGSETSGGETSGSSSADDGSREEAATDDTIDARMTDGEFTIETSDGQMTKNGSVVKITAAGTYTLSGLLEGQILVEAGPNDEVVLELNGVTITCGNDSPVKILSAGSADISAKAGTENVIEETRPEKTKDDADQGEGAVYAKADLKLKGSGTLVVTASYNNGIHTTKDLTVQKLSLKVTAPNNALKGNDSVTLKSGTIVAVSTKGDGVKTENTNADKNGNTRGDITLLGCKVTVYAAGDGFQAAHDFIMKSDSDGSSPVLAVYTGSYSGYTDANASTTSYKGIKVQNELSIQAGQADIKSYDDGLHADYGTSFEAGGIGQGTISISGGTVNITVYSPESSTGSGRMGPGGGGPGGGRPGGGGWGWGGGSGWGGQKTVSGADAIHADYKLNISGGVINVDSAYEGLEANVITITGGKTTVVGTDDGVNATKGVTTAQVIVEGGYLDVTVSPNGDTDGIDSNGIYRQTGGVVITRGPSSQMMAALDADSSVSITGGTLIVLGYGRVSADGDVKTYSLSLNGAGSHTVQIGGTSYTFENLYSYGGTAVYSDVNVTAG